jgi:hypothetical protein
MKSLIYRNILLALLAFLGLGSLGGGFVLMISANGVFRVFGSSFLDKQNCQDENIFRSTQTRYLRVTTPARA